MKGISGPSDGVALISTMRWIGSEAAKGISAACEETALRVSSATMISIPTIFLITRIQLPSCHTTAQPKRIRTGSFDTFQLQMAVAMTQWRPELSQ